MTVTEPSEKRLAGISTSPGICIGKAHIVDTGEVDIIEKYTIGEDGIQNEIKRFKTAVNSTDDELQTIIRETTENGHSDVRLAILETHRALLKDKKLFQSTITTIQDRRINAEWALKMVEADLQTKFQMMSNDYLKERGRDIAHVVKRILQNLVGTDPVDIGAINKRVILVAHELSASSALQINLERIKGVITDQGGEASHAGIIARTLGIPVVMGLENATKQIKNDEVIIVDGTSGTVVIYPFEQTLIDYEEHQFNYEKACIQIIKESYDTAETQDGFPLKIMGNIERPETVVSLLDHGGEGVGLYRTEFQYLRRPYLPGEDELFEDYKDVVEVVAPRPVTFRTLDINGDKLLDRDSYFQEANPALGQRGIRYCLKERGVFKTQLRAILRASAFGNVRILFPMVSCVNEILEAKEILKQITDSMQEEAVAIGTDIQVGIMVEVPSAVIMADVMADAVDFFSIGTNDLIQYTLAVDRGNRKVAGLFDPLHPAIIRLLHRVSQVAGEKGKKVAMCGEMAANPMHIPILLGLGIDELSMSPQSIPAVKRMIRSLNLSDCQQFLTEVLNQKTVREITGLVHDTYGIVVKESLYSTAG